MTDNVVKAGIEDVLSSVKRLVSEDGRKSAQTDAQAKPRKPGRLVLTDALRIGAPDADGQKAAPLKLEPEYSAEVSAKPMLLRASDIVRSEGATKDAKADDTTAEVGDKTETADPVGSLSAKIEALEAAIARTEDQWEPDGDSDDAYSGTPTQNLTWSAEEAFEAPVDAPKDDADDVDLSQTATFVRDPQVIASTDRAENADAAEKSAAEPNFDDPVAEAFKSQPAEDYAPVEEANIDEAPADEPTVADMADPVAEQEIVGDIVEGRAEVEPSQDQQPAVVIDEDALQELVAEVVRTELQGALGERITRNLRKMVRREIQRALAAQELE